MNRSWGEWDAKKASVGKKQPGKSWKQDSIGSRSLLETIAIRENYSTWEASSLEVLREAGIVNADGDSRVTTAILLTASAMVSDRTVPLLCLQVFAPMSTVVDSSVFALDAVGQTSALQPARIRLLATLLGELLSEWQAQEREMIDHGSQES